MADLGLIFKILTRNSPEIVELVNDVGGIGKVLQMVPKFQKIMVTLNEHNANRPDEAVPLQYGDDTMLKVKAFQEKHGLDPDGIVGDRTWTKVEQITKAAKK